MDGSGYTKRELELLFQRLEEKLDDIRDDIKTSNKYFEARLSHVEKDVENLKDLATKAMTVWAVIVTAVGFFLNKFL